MKLILGSQSQGRRAVLTNAGFTFDIMPADINEKAIRTADLEQLPKLIAQAKTDALLPKITEPSFLITSDTVAVYEGKLREKPESPEQAKAYLKSYTYAPVQTNTAVIVTNTVTGEQRSGFDIGKVYFSEVPDNVIEALIAEGDILQAAGAFVIENPLLKPYIVKIEGEHESVMGLPLQLTKQLLSEIGFK